MIKNNQDNNQNEQKSQSKDLDQISKKQIQIGLKIQNIPHPQSSLCLAILGCFGGLMVQLVIGSLYQWGIINIYITSYYKIINDPDIKLQNNAVVFPSMMICIGLTMRLGLWFCQITHPIIILFINQFVSAALIFVSSYMPNFIGFIFLYGIGFGLVAGLSFMIPIVECNKYYHGKKMIFNGIILIGTGMGSVVFGLFSYFYLNPNKATPVGGYYIGSSQLEEIAKNVPNCLKFLSLLYLIIGCIGVCMLLPILIINRRRQNHEKQIKQKEKQKEKQKQKQISHISNPSQKKKQVDNHHHHTGEADSIKTAICSKYWWIQFCILIFGSCGVFLINGNYKTYVKTTINDDQFLTWIGVVGSIGNGVSRFFWNLFFSKTGFKTVMIFNLAINIIVFSTIRFTVQIKQLYMLMVFLLNCCLGGFLVITPTFLQALFGPKVGSNVYGFFWTTFATTNFISYAYMAGLSNTIGFNGIIYIVLGMCVIAIPFVIVPKFQGQWRNDIKDLQYCSCCFDHELYEAQHYSKKSKTQNNKDSNSNSSKDQKKIKKNFEIKNIRNDNINKIEQTQENLQQNNSYVNKFEESCFTEINNLGLDIILNVSVKQEQSIKQGQQYKNSQYVQ